MMYDIEHAVNHQIGNKFREERATKNGGRGEPRSKWAGAKQRKGCQRFQEETKDRSGVIGTRTRCSARGKGRGTGRAACSARAMRPIPIWSSGAEAGSNYREQIERCERGHVPPTVGEYKKGTINGSANVLIAHVLAWRTSSLRSSEQRAGDLSFPIPATPQHSRGCRHLSPAPQPRGAAPTLPVSIDMPGKQLRRRAPPAPGHAVLATTSVPPHPPPNHRNAR